MINIRILMITLVLFEVIFFSHDNSSLIKEKILNPIVSPTPNQLQSSAEFYFYPGSNVILSKENTYVFEIEENPQKIIDWYKSRILKSNVVKKTFTETLNGGTTKSKLVAQINNKTVMVSINKHVDEKKTIVGLVIRDNFDF